MLPLPPGDVAARKNVEQFNVRGQPHPHIGAFEQVVTQQMRLREPARQQAMKRLQIIDPLAVIIPLACQVLVKVGHRVRVRIDPAGVGEDAREPRGCGAGKRGAHPRLNDGVTAQHRAAIGREPRLIERMSQCLDHPPCRLAQQLRIGVQRDDKPGSFELRAIPHTEQIVQFRPGFAHEKPVELFEFAALAFPSHPALLTFVPLTLAMKEEEPPRPVPAVQLLDAAHDNLQVFRILRHVRSRRVGKIAEQREAQICIRVPEKANLEALQFVADRIRRREHHRHHDQRAAIVRDAVLFERHLWQHSRWQQSRHQIVHGLHGQFTRREQEQDAEEYQHRHAAPVCRGDGERSGHQRHGEHCEASKI